MEKVRLWCGQPSDRGRLKNRTEQSINQNSQISRLCCQAIVHDILVVYGFQFYRCQPLVNGAASSYKCSYGQLTKHFIKLKLTLVKILVKRVVDKYLAKVVYMSPTSSGPTLARPHCSRHAGVRPLHRRQPSRHWGTHRLLDISKAGCESSAQLR